MRFLAGLLDEESLESLLRDILHPEGNPLFLLYHENLRLAAVCLHEAKVVPPDLENELIDPIDLLDCKYQIEFLSTWGRGRSENRLVGILQESNRELRELAAYALGEIRSQAAVPALIEVLKDPDKEVRDAAAYALGEIRSQVAIPALIEALKDPDKDFSWALPVALGKIKSEASAHALIETFKEPDKDPDPGCGR